MGYDIYIGQGVIDDPYGTDLTTKGYTPNVRVVVKSLALESAPIFPGDAMTGNGNSRHPAYSGWARFAVSVGLHDLFFDKEHGLMAEHPGTVRLCHWHLAAMREGLQTWRATHPEAIPGWCECPTCAPFRFQVSAVPAATHVDLDGDLARLIWLEWWVAYALSNCSVPCLHNR